MAARAGSSAATAAFASDDMDLDAAGLAELDEIVAHQLSRVNLWDREGEGKFSFQKKKTRDSHADPPRALAAPPAPRSRRSGHGLSCTCCAAAF